MLVSKRRRRECGEREASFHPREKRRMNMFLNCGRRWEKNELRVEQESWKERKNSYICFVSRKGLLNEKQETNRERDEEEIQVFMVTFFTTSLSLSNIVRRIAINPLIH